MFMLILCMPEILGIPANNLSLDRSAAAVPQQRSEALDLSNNGHSISLQQLDINKEVVGLLLSLWIR